DAHRRSRDRMIADRDQRPADAAVQQIAPDEEHQARDREREEIEPAVRVERNSKWCVRFDDHDALYATSPILDSLVLQQLRKLDGKGERSKREVHPSEPQRRQSEQESDDQTQRARNRNREPIRNAEAVHQDRRDVRADRVKGTMSQRYLPVVAG